MKLALAVAVALVASLAVVGAASADAPTIVQQSFPRTIPNFVPCPGFTVRGDFQVERTIMTFFDQSGTELRQVTHVHFVGTLTNTATGKALAEEGNQIATVDFVAGTSTTTGRVRVDTVPGEGVILAQVGHFVRDATNNLIFFAGQNDFVTGDFADFCAYMAAP